MRRSRLVVQVFSDAAISNASTTCAPIVSMSTRPLYGGGRGRVRGRGGRSFSDRPYNDERRDQFVTGDSHFQSVHDANHELRHGNRSSSSSNVDPRRYNHMQQQPPFNQNNDFRPPPPRGQWQSNHSPSGQNYTACPPPPFYQNQMSRPPPQRSFRQRPRSKPSDYREWEYAKTAPSPGSEKFVVLSYNILADYLANDHWRNLYFHIPRNMLSWGWRKSKIVFELGLWSADIMCLQEVDRFQDLEEDLKLRGYSGIWKMRTGNAVDGCAIFWRSNRFKLVHEESIQFNQLGLRDNVAQICVLETLLNSHTKEDEVSLSESCHRRVVICNIHVLFNPKRGDFKLGQVRTLLERAHAVAKLWDDAPVVLCGDFNCTPKSHLYNFISERKLDLSGIARDKVSGQDSAERRPPRPEIHTSRFQSVNKSPQAQVQPQDSVADVRLENNSNMDVGKAPSRRNTSELPCGDTILAGHEATSSSESVLPGEDVASDCNLGRENRKPDDAGDLSIDEVLSSVTISDPEPPHASTGQDDSREKLSASSVISATEHSREEIVPNAQNDSSILSSKVNSSAEMKQDGLTLEYEAAVFAQDEVVIGEDGEAFLDKLHSNSEDLSRTGELVNEFSRKSGSEAFDYGKITYNPSSWTPMEIATATGDPERSTVEHSMKLKSTYSEIEGQANTRDENGEPVVTSYHRCFMGTVDYIWRSEGLQTVRVLAPIPKQAMLWTPGFPTPKWGSDHIALVSELAFCSSKIPPKS